MNRKERRATSARGDEALGAQAEAARRLLDAGQLRQAERQCRRILAADPRQASALGTLGAIACKAGAVEDGLGLIEQAVSIDQDSPTLWLNLGLAFEHLERWDDALRSFDRACALRAGFAEAEVARGFNRLARGDIKNGLAGYEWRLMLDEVTAPRFHVPRWDGAPLRGRTIMLYGEQGLGDAIMFARYVPKVVERGGRIRLICHAPLHDLFRGLPVDEVAEENRTPFDTYASLASLPHLFGTTRETIPAECPYLPVEPAAVAAWKARLDAGARLRCGLVWAGNPAFKNDRLRSPQAGPVAPLLTIPGIAWYSLQKAPGPRDLETLRAAGRITDLSAELADFSVTAAALSALDLVVTSDTAVAHLGGALGRPTWVMLSSPTWWAWMREGDATPWYPTARLFRQRRRGDWTETVGRLKVALEAMAGSETRA